MPKWEAGAKPNAHSMSGDSREDFDLAGCEGGMNGE